MATNRHFAPRLSPLEAWSFSLGGIIGWGVFVMPGNTFLPTGGPVGTAIAFCVSAVVMVVIALNLHYMMNRFPVAGGAFIYAKNTFGHTHGFICGWFLALAYLAIIPQNATALALISRNLMGGILEVGPSYNIAGYDTYLSEMVLVALVLAVLALIAIRSTKAVGIAQAVFASCLVVGVSIIVITIAMSPAAATANLEPTFAPQIPPLMGTVGVMVIAPWAFVGFEMITQLSEDIRFSPRWAGLIMVLAIGAGAIIYIAMNFSAITVLPPGYADWPAYINDLPNLSGLESLPVFYAVHQVMGPVGLFVLDLATIGAVFTCMICFALGISRLLFAMALEGALPAWFGQLHTRYGTPANTLICVFAVAFALSFLGRSVLSWIVDVSSVGASIAFLYASLATMHTAAREGKTAWRIAGAFGVVMSGLFIALLLVPIAALNNMHDMGSYVLLVTWVVLGVNLFTPEFKSSPTQISQIPDDIDH